MEGDGGREGEGRKEKGEGGGEGEAGEWREEGKSRRRMAYKCTIIVRVSANSPL